MRYYVTFDESGKLAGYMEYEHLNATMQEVTEEEYRDIMRENGIPYEPTPKPEPAPTLEERVGSLEQSKANQADVDELNEALNMILTGATR